jgi:hypothetical protein
MFYERPIRRTSPANIETVTSRREDKNFTDIYRIDFLRTFIKRGNVLSGNLKWTIPHVLEAEDVETNCDVSEVRYHLDDWDFFDVINVFHVFVCYVGTALDICICLLFLVLLAPRENPLEFFSGQL